MRRDESVYLRHVLDAIEKIETYLDDLPPLKLEVIRILEEVFAQEDQEPSL